MTYIFRKKSTIKRRFLCLAFIIACGFVSNTATVLAIPDLDFYSGNDILFYDPDANGGCDSEGGGTASLVGNDNAEKIWNFLVGKGLSSNQAAGVMGNIKAESGFNPGIVEHGSGVGFGIVQWSHERRAALEAAARKKGVSPADLAFQLEYLYQELLARKTNRPEYSKFSSEWDMIKGQQSIEDALVAFHHEFEISHLMNEADPRAAVIRERGQFAKDAFASFSKNTPSASTQSQCKAGPQGDLAKTTLAYAWPKYRGNDIAKKPEYETAVKQAEAQGKYVGGCRGVDCGAFVTLLINNSGFDPQYNSAGRGGNTVEQRKWAEKNWETVGNGASIDTGKLQPGDVALLDGHTFVYVGDIPGFESKIASASQCQRAPMAGTESLVSGGVTWFRKK